MANDELPNEIPVPDIPALKVTVSDELSPKVVFPVTETSSASVKVPVESETFP